MIRFHVPALRMRSAATALTLALACPGAAMAAKAEQPVKSALSDADRALLQKALEARQTSDCKKAVRLLDERLRQRVLEEPKLKITAYGVEMICNIRLGNYDRAHFFAVEGIKLDDADKGFWYTRLAIETDKGPLKDAVATVEELANGRGAILNSIPQQLLFQLDRKLSDANMKTERKALLRVLSGSGYAPDEAMASGDGFRMRLAMMLLDDGDGADAQALVKNIEDPSILLGLGGDKRTRDLGLADLDIRAQFERGADRARLEMRRHDGALRPMILGAQYLRRLGRPQEALDLLFTAQKRRGGPDGFEDSREMANWWWDSLGRTHAVLGNMDAAISSLRNGAGAAESGGTNVSQTINLAELLNRLNRPEDALKVLAVFDDGKLAASPYGFAEMHFARGCAAALAGKADLLAGDLAYLRAHEKDHPEALNDLQLCMGDTDAAAASFVARLDDPERREAALSQLNDYDAPPSTLPPDPLYRKIGEIKARSDVAAAIARAGGVRRIPLQRDEL